MISHTLSDGKIKFKLNNADSKLSTLGKPEPPTFYMQVQYECYNDGSLYEQMFTANDVRKISSIFNMDIGILDTLVKSLPIIVKDNDKIEVHYTLLIFAKSYNIVFMVDKKEYDDTDTNISMIQENRVLRNRINKLEKYNDELEKRLLNLERCVHRPRMTAYHKCPPDAKYNYEMCYLKLMKRFNFDGVNLDAFLHEVARNARPMCFDQVQILIDAGADVNYTNGHSSVMQTCTTALNDHIKTGTDKKAIERLTTMKQVLIDNGAK
jgi:hypothetical protein